MNDRVHTRLPLQELERRWTIVRRRLRETGADALVVLNSEDYLGAHVRWLTDIPTAYAYHTAVVFHADDRMTLVAHGAMGRRQDVPAEGSADHPGIGEVLYTATFHSVMQTWRYEAELVSAALRRRGSRKVALAGTGGMPHGFVMGLMEDGGFQVFDDTDFYDHARAIKSEVEQAEIRAVAAMQDAIFAEVLPSIRPGMRDMDVAALCQMKARSHGGEQGVFLVGSAPPGEPAVMRFPHQQARAIAAGDAVTILIENNGPTGYYTELGRTVVLGQASNALTDAFALAAEAQSATIGRFRPGVSCAEVAATHDDFLARQGFAPELRVYSHGQGYALVERPLIRSDETMSVAAGMSLTCHPNFVGHGVMGYLCDNVLVGEGGCEPIHRTEKRIFEIG